MVHETFHVHVFCFSIFLLIFYTMKLEYELIVHGFSCSIYSIYTQAIGHIKKQTDCSGWLKKLFPIKHDHMRPMWAIGGKIAIWVLSRIHMGAKGPRGGGGHIGPIYIKISNVP